MVHGCCRPLLLPVVHRMAGSMCSTGAGHADRSPISGHSHSTPSPQHVAHSLWVPEPFSYMPQKSYLPGSSTGADATTGTAVVLATRKVSLASSVAARQRWWKILCLLLLPHLSYLKHSPGSIWDAKMGLLSSLCKYYCIKEEEEQRVGECQWFPEFDHNLSYRRIMHTSYWSKGIMHFGYLTIPYRPLSFLFLLKSNLALFYCYGRHLSFFFFLLPMEIHFYTYIK